MSQGGISVSVFVRRPPYLYPPGSVNGRIRIRYSDEYPYLVVALVGTPVPGKHTFLGAAPPGRKTRLQELAPGLQLPSGVIKRHAKRGSVARPRFQPARARAET